MFATVWQISRGTSIHSSAGSRLGKISVVIRHLEVLCKFSKYYYKWKPGNWLNRTFFSWYLRDNEHNFFPALFFSCVNCAIGIPWETHSVCQLFAFISRTCFNICCVLRLTNLTRNFATILNMLVSNDILITFAVINSLTRNSAFLNLGKITF